MIFASRQFSPTAIIESVSRDRCARNDSVFIHVSCERERERAIQRGKYSERRDGCTAAGYSVVTIVSRASRSSIQAVCTNEIIRF